MKILLESTNIQKDEIAEVVNEIFQIRDSDPFLREKLNLDELTLILDKESIGARRQMRSFAHAKKNDSGEVEKKLSINLIALKAYGFDDYKLRHELYHLPGIQNIFSIYETPQIVLRLNEWRKKLTDDEFFGTYDPLHMMLFDIGVDFGIMLNNPDFAERCYDLHSLAMINANTVILNHPRDYQYHFALGIPTLLWASYLLAGTIGKSEKTLTLGNKFRNDVKEMYELSHPLVHQKLSECGDLIVKNNPFTDDYTPRIYGDVGYVSLVEKMLKDCAELKESLGQYPSHIFMLREMLAHKQLEQSFMKSVEEANHSYS